MGRYADQLQNNKPLLRGVKRHEWHDILVKGVGGGDEMGVPGWGKGLGSGMKGVCAMASLCHSYTAAAEGC
mgnify:CR=1 FL=1